MCHKTDLKFLLLVVVEGGCDITQLQMGVVPMDSLVDVVVHMDWEGCMLVVLTPYSQ